MCICLCFTLVSKYYIEYVTGTVLGSLSTIMQLGRYIDVYPSSMSARAHGIGNQVRAWKRTCFISNANQFWWTLQHLVHIEVNDKTAIIFEEPVFSQREKSIFQISMSWLGTKEVWGRNQREILSLKASTEARLILREILQTLSIWFCEHHLSSTVQNLIPYQMVPFQ